MLSTAYELPFAVRYPDAGFFSSGRDVRLTVRLRKPASPDLEQAVDRVFSSFAALAAIGGLSGADIDPTASGISECACVSAEPLQRTYELRACRIDDHALVTLSDMLLHGSIAPSLERVTVHGTGELVTLVTSFPQLLLSQPIRYKQLPFSLIDESPELGGFTFALSLASPPTPDHLTELQESFDTWTAFVLSGGFALAPIPPDDTYVEPDNPLVDFENTVEWAFFKFRAHPAAIDSLINIIVRFHGRGCRLVELSIA